MPDNIETILREDCALVKDRPIIVGVSGGPDSLCLMEILRQAGYPIIVAHFDHQLRAESGQEARIVEKTATRLMLASTIDGADVRAYAEEAKLSIEEAARNLRYRFLFELANRQHAQAVAVGHTADDQVETILMHFLRGSALSGLKGMSYRSHIKMFDPDIPLVRPLLNMWREETVVFCEVNGMQPHYDSSNDSLDFQRNRIRHLLIPNLATYNPKFREAVLRMSQALQGDYTFMMEILEKAWQATVVKLDEDIVTLKADLLSGHSLGLQRNLIKRAIQTLQPGIDISFSVLERAIKLIGSAENTALVELKGGLRMFREASSIYIYTLNAKLPFDLWPQMMEDRPVSVSIPGQAALAGGWKFNCERWPHVALAREQARQNEDPFQAWLDAESLSDTLELRARQARDHFVPLGLDGHSQKLSDFFVNEKVPHRARGHWPLLCASDEIIWVPGYRPAHPYRLTSETLKVVRLSVTRPLEKILE
ncbi:MAG TPA: tRNA lysidine(34) synthetase TilS [Anaerolineales bacterium]|nr:tRNA lysidine(34) synthetase TilS [Anaerolineales bacterium]